jgi:transcriptional regulator with PAS, ATPase and Fis domain
MTDVVKPVCTLEDVERMVTKLGIMAAITNREGAILFSNGLFRTFFSHLGSDIREIQPLASVFSAEHKGIHCIRTFTAQERSLLAAEISLEIADRDRVLVFLFFDVDADVLVSEEQQAMRERLELLQAILDASAEGLMFVNTDGIITYINHSYEVIHNVRAENVIGRHVTDIIENTRMHLVVKTGIPEIAEFQLESKRRYVVSRIPVFKDNQLIGAIGEIIFRDFDKVEVLAYKVERLKQQLEFYRNRPEVNQDLRYTADDIVAVAAGSENAKCTALRVAPTDSTVLLLGESGVGKEVYAHAIHAMSLRSRGPFIRVNCSAIVESLFESELFGYAEGAFTGAAKGGRAGKFELANMGTIFLDEIADMPLEAQAKLLRVLQEQEVEKLGGGKQIKVDVRVIAATNQDLKKLIREGKFRKDLFFRINVIPICIPPLRERPEDVSKLASVFWEQLSRKHGGHYKTLSADAMAFLHQYEWPGNVRELHNLLERAIAIVRDHQITAGHLRVLLQGGVAVPDGSSTEDCRLEVAVEAAERKALSTALARCNNNRAQAARLLGITRPLLYKKMHQYQLL